MAETARARGALIMGLLVLCALGLVAAVVAYRLHTRPVVAVEPPATAPSTRPAVPPATRKTAPPATHPQAVDSYMAVIRAEYPALPTTQPLSMPLDVSQAGRLILKDPVYLSGPQRADLWITRLDAPPTAQVLRAATNLDDDAQTHVLRENVVYVHWMPVETGVWPPYLICRASEGKFELVTANYRRPLPTQRDYRWDRAWSWNEKIVVPTRTGVAILRLEPQITESYHELAVGGPTTQPSDLSEPQTIQDWQGILAWLPWENGKAGGRGAARFVENKWTDLGPDAGWPEKILHLIPFQDGTVLQMVAQEPGVQLTLASLEHVQVDEQKIKELVEQLDDTDEQVRKKAFEQLTTFGAGAFPILEKLAQDQGPQAQAMIRQLLKNQVAPNLGGMSLLGDKSLKLVSRLSDGGAVFYAEHGVSAPNAEGDATPIAPAWIACRPGYAAQLLPQMMVNDLRPDKAQFEIANNQWLVTADVRGPRLFFGNGFTTLLHKDERAYAKLVGTDRFGRWLFRKPDNSNETLVIDPRLPDPTPRLPVWDLGSAEAAGWDKDNWPAIKRGGTYALQESGWRAMEPNEKLFKSIDEIPVATQPVEGPSAATRPASRPTTSPSDGSEPPLLIDPDGTRYFGGLTDLRVIKPRGSAFNWPLPPLIEGKGPVWLIHTQDDRLFLFNQPGRVVRLKPLPGGRGFEVEKTFTHDIPAVDHPTRIWLDPAGRIDLVWGDHLAVLFPQGFIPRAISELMLKEGDDVAGP